MPATYRQDIQTLILDSPFEIDLDAQVSGRPPTMASSEFLTNKQQGDWAEKIVLHAINDNSPDYVAIAYGRSDSLAAGDEGFAEFYADYQDELNTIGKKPDILIYRRGSFKSVGGSIDLEDDRVVSQAVAGIEVRSSSFLAEQYSRYMSGRTEAAVAECIRIKNEIMGSSLGGLLREKCQPIHDLVCGATGETFKDLDFRCRNWSTTGELRQLSALLKRLKAQIKILHKRDYLSITPKLEDVAQVNRWIQRYGVPHYYLQVFFDKAYVIPFKEILEIASTPEKEGFEFSVERDVKNQQKTTIKINVQVGREVLGKIDMPEHRSELKELDRGRLLFYVTFEGGKGYLDSEIFTREIGSHE